jgi:hypothetical protein
MGNLKIKGLKDRSKINMHEPHEVQCWIKHLKVSQEQLQKAVDKVGNGAAAVRKELAAEAVKRARGVGELPAGRELALQQH